MGQNYSLRSQLAEMTVALKETAPLQPPAIMSIDEIRSCFPALARTHNGHPVAYFDGPGGTQVPRTVVEAMNDYLYHHNANTHWAYPTSEETDAIRSEEHTSELQSRVDI